MSEHQWVRQGLIEPGADGKEGDGGGRRRHFPRAAIVLALAFFAPTLSHAQSITERQQADRLAAEAVRAFQVDHYDDAYRKAKVSYALSSEPDKLFILAQALFACWDFDKACADGGKEGNRREGADAFARFITAVEADRVLIRKSGEDLDMARNHKLELEEAASGTAQTKPPRGREESEELLRRSKLSLLRRQADRDYAVWKDTAAEEDRRYTASASAQESYKGIVGLVKASDSDSLDLALAAVARDRLSELETAAKKRPRPAVVVAPAPKPAPVVVAPAPPPAAATSQETSADAHATVTPKKKSKLWVLGVVGGVVVVGAALGVGLALGLPANAPDPMTSLGTQTLGFH